MENGNYANYDGQDFDSMPPVVAETFPQAGTVDVRPGIGEIRVKFSKDMQNGSWSWSNAWEDCTPELIDQPKYEMDRRTCVVKVKFSPNKNYGFWLNSENFTNFRDAQGRPAVPYLLTFRTHNGAE
jgi:hypothetical protein